MAVIKINLPNLSLCSVFFLLLLVMYIIHNKSGFSNQQDRCIRKLVLILEDNIFMTTTVFQNLFYFWLNVRDSVVKKMVFN